MHLDAHQGFQMQRLDCDIVDMPFGIHVGITRFNSAMETIGFQLASPVVVFHVQSSFCDFGGCRCLGIAGHFSAHAAAAKKAAGIFPGRACVSAPSTF
jgi:hypothetical protein